MDEQSLYERLNDKHLFDRAFVYTIHDRIQKDTFCNFFEINFYQNNKTKLQEDIRKIIECPEDFRHSVCFSYYVPKDDVCMRRYIYIPFKELILRYILIMVIVELTEYTLSNKCFSYRKASEKNQRKNLFEPYQILWNKYVDWQENTLDKFGVLIKTDISSFYDTVSHNYLIKILLKQLDISENCKFIFLFKKVLNLRVVNYSFLDHSLLESEFLQGLVIGNQIDGYLANIYLHDIDEALEKVGAEFGRYVDDTKIFTNSKEDSLYFSRIIQECLLKKGLNLNAYKTKIWEGKKEIKKTIKKEKIQDYFSLLDENLDDIENKDQSENNKFPIDEKMDKDAFMPKSYNPDKEIKNLENAKLWATYINQVLKPNKSLDNELTIRQVRKIKTILQNYPSINPVKTCAWLIVRFCFWGYPNSVQKAAYNEMLDILQDEKINSWTKARILHHVIKPNRGTLSYIKRLNTSPKQIAKFKAILHELIIYPSVELQINALYAIYEILEAEEEITNIVTEFIPKPIPLPIRDIISQLQTLNFKSISLATIDEIMPEAQENQEDIL
ncbi:MAG: RNA-directed DNA polymerase [Spirulina sp.]